jgi:hexokinase
MSNINIQEIAAFARYYGFHYDIIDPDALVRDFCADMDRGLCGKTSSMPMIPSHLRPVANVPSGKTVLAIDAGGTNLRAARVRFDEEGNPVAEDERRAAMPGTEAPMTADEFYNAIADVCAPLFDGGSKIEGIGFCFSYSMEITEDCDGIPLSFSKQSKVPDAVGKPIGKNLLNALAKRKINAPQRIILLNDTTATLLSGIAKIPTRFQDKTNDKWSIGEDKVGVIPGPVIGFILGTGLNSAYPETSIPKIGFKSNVPQIVVAESGNFINRNRGELDIEYDKTTTNVGLHTTEKAIAGAYLGPLSLFIIKQAIKDGILKFKKSDQMLKMESLQTRDLNEFLNNPLSLSGPVGSLFGADEKDAIASLVYLESIVSERAALLAAGILAGTVEHISGAYDPLSPVRIAVEGTTYLRYYHIRESLEARFRAMIGRKNPRHCIIQTVEQASLFGAAVAALSS